MVGLDGSGKTTILYQLKLGKNITSLQTTGFNLEQFRFGSFKLKIFDIGGFQTIWKHFLYDIKGLIFVVDCSDLNRIEEAKEKLHNILGEDELKDTVLLVFANKQDLPSSLRSDDLQSRLNLRDIKDRPWKVQECCATTGYGIKEGFEWFCYKINHII
ncbi:small GTP-binding protein, putative [Trichomonas vaginalis G3]|uniref:Small GTP-binding protein, putative n=1 Tax=Trichomonas vaginalis (strain ATCC PRA-98 / G3) TaxID=412133 RepID=A2FPX6_TRIV3|nr:GTP binding [Trichomonas vaginalis G3]EAX93035.1 small GTP-binding protein, putative [Trichomonas vaginalis G3]KAI5543781.1 GTP binding [Trichomonas vaginalis G3]|eukprot:XP_001305965.1 small GTP-binding protein [Trichomonas vaginalis G3]